MKNIKAIFFDIGNVILYFDNHRVSRGLAEISLQSEARIFGEVFDLYAEMELDLGKTPIPEFLLQIQKKLNLKADLQILKIVFSDIFTENIPVSSLIRHLKGKIPIIGITNTNESHFEYIQEHFPVLSILNAVIASYNIGIKKPDPGIYHEALKFAKALPQECLFIDDQEKNIIPAKLLGFQTLHYQSYENLVRCLDLMGIL